MLGRLVHRADFERLLGSPPRCRSAHFVIHYEAPRALARPEPEADATGTELSTASAPPGPTSVDKSVPSVRLGIAIPKRHARRAVTRNLLRRLVRAVFVEHGARLPVGNWLVRLKAPFARAEFVSAASRALAQAARAELEALVRRLAVPLPLPAAGGVAS